MAVSGDMTVFSCEYRLAPETIVPGGILDAYAAVNYITSHAKKFNIDPTRIGIYGPSGGGFIVSGLTYELAKRDKTHLIKIVYLDAPQLFGNFWFNPDSDFTEVETNYRHQHLGCFNLLTESENKDHADPYQFAPSMGNDLISKLPMHIFVTHEFDFFLRDTKDYIKQLEKHNLVLDVLYNPGTFHMS